MAQSDLFAGREALTDLGANATLAALSEEAAACRRCNLYRNAAMRRMQETGYLPGALRAYWAKGILAWAPDPQYALRTALDLNNCCFLDGGDHSSFANVLWAFGLHDRPVAEAPVFGKVRPMSRERLERQIDLGRFLAAA